MSERNQEGLVIRADNGEAYYNGGIAQLPGATLVIARAVKIREVEWGTPDYNTTRLWEVDSSGKTVTYSKSLVFPSTDGVLNWEDARCLVKGNGRIVIGMTAVTNAEFPYNPHPALMIGKVDREGRFRIVEGPNVFPVVGKNFTPLNDRDEFLFRQEEDSHLLRKVVIRDGKLEQIGVLDFGCHKRDWMKRHVGTTGYEIDFGHEDLRILPIHGVSMQNGRFDYSLGISIIDRGGRIKHVGHEPLVRRPDFQDVVPVGIELHNVRNVVYSTGYKREGDVVTFNINVGDLAMDMSREFTIRELLDNALK